MPYINQVSAPEGLAGPAGDRPTSGDAVQTLCESGRRYAAMIRVVTLPITVTVAVLAADSPRMRFACVVAGALLSAWSVFYAWRVYHRPSLWVTVVDAFVLAVLALTTALLVPSDWLSSGKSWLVPFSTFACVAYQYYERWLAGSLAGLIVIAGMVVGTITGRPDGSVIDGVITACWAVVVAGLARLLWTLVHRGGELADRKIAEAETARRQLRIAAMVRADERTSNRDLHDNAATTLLMVGLGEISPKIPSQAARDLELLRAPREGHLPSRTDLCDLLTAACGDMPFPVVRRGAEQLLLPTKAALAFAGAAVEALTNVGRHSGAGRAEVHVFEADGEVTVEIRDTGRGFDPGRVPATRRGVRESIVGRMAEINGVATVESVAHRGTTVLLRWENG